jgi:hypothetical protein
VKFDYLLNDVNAQGKHGAFEYRLPETIHTLSKWAQHLDNCMSSYDRVIHGGYTIIFGVFEEDVLLYAVEIKKHKIVQALGIDNKSIVTKDRNEIEIEQWFKNMYLLRYKKGEMSLDENIRNILVSRRQ